MSRRCELSGTGVLVGNHVSHSNIKTKRRFLPNLNRVTLHSEILERPFSFRVSAATLRSVDRRGGLDAYVLKERDDSLSRRALAVKRDIQKALAHKAEQDISTPEDSSSPSA